MERMFLLGAIQGVTLLFVAGLSLRVLSLISGQQKKQRDLTVLLQKLAADQERTERVLFDGLASLREELRHSTRDGREEMGRNVAVLGENIFSRLKEVGELQRTSLRALSEQLGQLTQLNDTRMLAVQGIVEEKLNALQTGNEQRLEAMRKLVDEKLHATLEKRLGEAFSSVSDRLERVHQGLGEMRVLTSDIGDLKKVLANVKVRGTWGEIQLGALLDQILSPEQYAKNVAPIPGRAERVEFAIRLPGGEGDAPLWLPIDSKFPQEDYLRLLAAGERGDVSAVAESTKALERRLLLEAKSIREKYISPPDTTDFAILYLPTEGLYAEALRIDGLCERLMREHRVVISGPTTIAALLNSLQMGFRTLAVKRRSSEVWSLLGQVKTEFHKFGDVLDKARVRIEQVGKDLSHAQVRSRSIVKRLKDVQELSLTDSSGIDSLDNKSQTTDEEQE